MDPLLSHENTSAGSRKDGATRISVPRLCVTALSGGGGKTLLALGLGRALVERGITVKPFKKGPDYIDAAWLARACRNSATNLDPFFLSPEALRTLFYGSLVPKPGGMPPGMALLEGNRGLFDGFDAKGTCSTAELARLLGMPLVLSLDCTKMTRTAAALVQGVLNFETGLVFLGVVLNNVGSSRHARHVRDAIEGHTDLPVLGALPRLIETPLPERHMGI
ncbi:MAG: cobyrinic acid a,c-diamide synthase, partial [Desulfovibrio sp.]|nr:cobyrinic acid a,c-diamide synthase [Desulfovibrio sp.]